jgi:hypothetical protein
MIANQRVLTAVSKLTGVPEKDLRGGARPELAAPTSLDSLDLVELVMELEDEFDEQTLRWAVRYIEALAKPPAKDSRRSSSGGADLLWDPELDA